MLKFLPILASRNGEEEGNGDDDIGIIVSEILEHIDG
jgi:hypothetical protein